LLQILAGSVLLSLLLQQLVLAVRPHCCSLLLRCHWQQLEADLLLLLLLFVSALVHGV
jgi:hypothetical protein